MKPQYTLKGLCIYIVLYGCKVHQENLTENFKDLELREISSSNSTLYLCSFISFVSESFFNVIHVLIVEL